MEKNYSWILKRTVFALIMCFSFTLANAQDFSVSGTIIDSDGATIPGVNVTIKDTYKGVVSDIDGNFSIKVPNNKSVIVLSFVGMKTQEIVVGNKRSFAVTMETNGIGLDEVVAVGYGSVKKSDLSGSVSSISVDGMGDKPYTSVDQLLQGTAAGVNMSLASGAPGAAANINIRGISTINGSSTPLIVIDGFEMSDENGSVNLENSGTQPTLNPLANLNPNEIESIEVLKDASSTAIYGSRGANGVILITTKSGQNGGRVSYNYRMDLASLPKQIDVLGTRDYLEYRNLGYEEMGDVDSYYTPEEIDSVVGIAGDVNWQDEIYRTSISQEHNISITGGDEKTKFAVNLGYTDVEGIIISSDLKRYSIRSNFSRDVYKWLSINANVSYNKTNSHQIQHSTSFGTVNSSVVLAALFTRPIYSNVPSEDDLDDDGGFTDNPVTIATKILNNYELESTLGRFGYTVNLAKGLTYKGNVNFNSSGSLRQRYYPRGTSVGDSNGGKALYGKTENFNYGFEQVFNYNGRVAKGQRLSAVLGASYKGGSQKSLKNEATGFINDELAYNYLQGAVTSGKLYTTYLETELASVFARANYTIKDKYIATFTGRYDGTSRLNEHWSFFPSGALAWRVNQEKFLKDYDALSNFKIRTSYGLSGRQSVKPLASQTVLASTTFVVGETWSTAVFGSSQGQNGQLGNPDLKWETTAQINIGTDVSFIDNRFRLTFDWFQKNTKDLLLALPLADSDAYSSIWTNIGEIENRGIELELGANIIQKEFTWDVSGTFSKISNKILDLGELDQVFGGTWINAGGIQLNQPLHIAKVGHEVGAFYGYHFDGIYQNQDEIDAGPQKDAQPGDWKIKDIAGATDANGNVIGDGEITAEDQEVIGSATPDFVFGFGTNFAYKRLALSVFFSGSYGNEVLNLNRYVSDALATEVNRNVRQEAYDNRWQGDGSTNEFGRVRGDANLFNTMPSDYWIEDASYIRLKNVTLSYFLPVDRISFINKIRVFASGSNLFLLTKYSGYDPEVSARNSALEPGVDFGVFPQARVYSFGASLEF